MKIQNILLFSACICCPLYAAVLNQGAQSKPVVDEACQTPIPFLQWIVKHIESGGIGYNHGYTTLQGFFPANPNRMDLVPYLDVRAHVFDDGRFASNAGIGLRKMMKSRVWGMNAYYDYRNAKHKSFNQIGLGLETLGRNWDAFVNGYIPVGSLKSSGYSPKFSHFEGNHLILSQKYEFAMYGIHGEAGYHMQPNRNTYLYFGAGPYYFQGPIGKSACGAMVRVSAQICRMVSFEIRDSYDSLFHNHFQGQVGLSWSFGPKAVVKKKYEEKKSCPSFSSLDTVLTKKLIQPPERDEIVVIDRSRKNAKAIHPATNSPFLFYFVDNTSNSAGTFKSPFPTLAQAESASASNDVIYVFPGDGTTTGMDSGITLKSNQQFLGSGVAQPLQTAQGFIVIPSLSATTPIITNTAGDGVSLADSATLRGIDVLTATGNGVSGSSLNQLTIDLCTIRDSGARGISLTQAVDGTINLTRSSVIQNTTDGVQISASSNAAVAVNVDDCILSLNGIVSGNGLNLLSSDNATYIASLKGSEFNLNLNQGLNLTSSSNADSQLSFVIENSQFNTNSQGGILAPFSGSAPIFVSLKQSQVSCNSGSVIGSAIFSFASSQNTFLADEVRICENSHGGSGLGALYLSPLPLSALDATIKNSTVQANASLSGVYYTVDGTFTGNLNLIGNVISEHSLAGLQLITASNASTGNPDIFVTLENNSIERNNGGVFEVSTRNVIPNTLDVSFINNRLESPAGASTFTRFTTSVNAMNVAFSGNDLVSFDDSFILVDGDAVNRNISFDGNECRGGGSSPVLLFLGTTANSSLSLTNNHFSELVQGSLLSISPNGDYNYQIIGNVFDVNAIFNPLIAVTNNSSSGDGVLEIKDNVINSMGSLPVIQFNNTGGGGALYSCEISGNEISNVNGLGVQVNFSGSSTAPVDLNISDNLFSFLRDSSISISDSSTSNRIVTTTLANNICKNSVNRGIDISKTGTAVFKIDSNNNTFFQNGSSLSSSPQAFRIVQNNAGSSTCLNLSVNSSDNGYLITNTAGTFNLAPIDVEAVNVGAISTSGTITPVSSCP